MYSDIITTVVALKYINYNSFKWGHFCKTWTNSFVLGKKKKQSVVLRGSDEFLKTADL